ncbi:MAG: hypothetical protein V3S13_00545, partial [Candidatus Omnitrophota bacterium]
GGEAEENFLQTSDGRIVADEGDVIKYKLIVKGVEIDEYYQENQAYEVKDGSLAAFLNRSVSFRRQRFKSFFFCCVLSRRPDGF